MLIARRRLLKAGLSLPLLSSPAIARGGFAPLDIATPAQQAVYVATAWGGFIHFSMATFLDIENAPTNEPFSTYAPSSGPGFIDQWIATAVAAKWKTLTYVVKHIDGFCQWPTASTSYNVTNTPWYAANGSPNLASLFATKCRAAGITPEFYFSVQDAQVASLSLTTAQTLAYIQLQLTELLTQNGPIGAIWMDRAEPAFQMTGFPWDSIDNRYRFIRGLQSSCLLVNNSKTASNVLAPTTDIAVYELSGNPVPGNTIPSEVAAPMRVDNNWFWKTGGNTCLDAPTIEATLATLSTRTAVYRLNAGPDTTGNIPSNMVSVLTTVGASLP